MMIHELTQKTGKYTSRKRLGRGVGSGLGKTSGRGVKGAGSRSGWGGSIKPLREGGQMPFYRRLPKRGFNNANFRTEYFVVNVKALEARFDDGAEVNPDMLVKMGLIPDTKTPVKVLGEGELSKKLTVSAAKFSSSAKEKIEKAGGSVTVIA
jgi:large subunit ribosomal protein L15